MGPRIPNCLSPEFPPRRALWHCSPKRTWTLVSVLACQIFCLSLPPKPTSLRKGCWSSYGVKIADHERLVDDFHVKRTTFLCWYEGTFLIQTVFKFQSCSNLDTIDANILKNKQIGNKFPSFKQVLSLIWCHKTLKKMSTAHGNSQPSDFRPLHWAALLRAPQTFHWPERPLVTLHGHALAEKVQLLKQKMDVFYHRRMIL